MVQIDIPAGFVISMLAIDLGRKALKKDYQNSQTEKSTLYYRYLFRSVLFAGMVIAPAGIYLLAGWPGWEQIYWSKRFEEVMHTGWVNALLPALFDPLQTLIKTFDRLTNHAAITFQLGLTRSAQPDTPLLPLKVSPAPDQPG